MTAVIQFIPIIAGLICIKKYKFKPATFYVMFIVSVCGLGFYYNNLTRIGSIFHTDLYLVLFILALIVYNDSVIKVNRLDFAILCGFVALQLFFGLICHYGVSDILGDFKLVLYFFVPYFYGKSIKHNKKENVTYFKTYCACIIITLVLNWIEFFNSGLEYINTDSNQIIRTFGIGLGFSCGALITCLLMDYKNVFVRKYGYIPYYIIHILLIISSIVSFTRTSWISYILTVAINWFFVSRKSTNIRTKNDLIKNLLNIAVVMLIVVALLVCSARFFPATYNSIVTRFNSIFAQDTTGNNVDTFSARIDDVSAGIDVFWSPRILCGYGYGALYKNSHGVYFAQSENSFVYYLWKYGIIAGVYLFARTFKYIKKKTDSFCMADNTYAVSCLMSLILGSMSGNLNRPYPLAALGILMGLNWQAIFEKPSKRL